MGQQETVAGSALRRMIMTLAVTALMAAMIVVMAVPAMAKTDKDYDYPAGQPTASGSERSSVVAHCKAIDGTKSVTVTQLQNDENHVGGGDCPII